MALLSRQVQSARAQLGARIHVASFRDEELDHVQLGGGEVTSLHLFMHY